MDSHSTCLAEASGDGRSTQRLRVIVTLDVILSVGEFDFVSFDDEVGSNCVSEISATRPGEIETVL